MAAVNPFIFRDDRRGFNTQPPEGGCKLSQNIVNEVIDSFNTQPPEGGCPFTRSVNDFASRFQHTATRRWLHTRSYCSFKAQYHTQRSHPTVAALSMMLTETRLMVSTHSHPKVAASDFKRPPFIVSTFQHTATRRWLPFAVCGLCESVLFQHTATRRWLLLLACFPH